MHILLPEIENCPSWISGRERNWPQKIFHDQISTIECCQPGGGRTRNLLITSRTCRDDWSDCVHVRADYHAKLWLSGYYYYHGYNIMMHHETNTISKSHSFLMNFVDFIKTRLPVKIPNITALSNISFATILRSMFAKQKSFLFSYFVNLDKKASEWYYRRKTSTGIKTIKTVDSWRDYRQ